MIHIGHKTQNEIPQDRFNRISGNIYTTYDFPSSLIAGLVIWVEYERGVYDIYELTHDYASIDELTREVSSLFPYRQ